MIFSLPEIYAMLQKENKEYGKTGSSMQTILYQDKSRKKQAKWQCITLPQTGQLSLLSIHSYIQPRWKWCEHFVMIFGFSLVYSAYKWCTMSTLINIYEIILYAAILQSIKYWKDQGKQAEKLHKFISLKILRDK